MIPAITSSPAVNDPVLSRSQPMRYGPAKPPVVPMVLMKANPPAAATPVRNRVGIVQNTARAAVTPTKASVRPASAGTRDVVMTETASPTAASAQVSVRWKIFFPVRSTCQAQAIMPADANV